MNQICPPESRTSNRMFIITYLILILTDRNGFFASVVIYNYERPANNNVFCIIGIFLIYYILYYGYIKRPVGI